jgi:hypothetical protein
MQIRSMTASLALAFTIAFQSQGLQKPRVTGVDVQISRSPGKPGQLHWKIENKSSSSEVYVYSFFLYGPAYGTENKEGKTILDTLPPAPEGGCPNRFPPVLLLRVPPGDYREGDFRDPQLRVLSGKTVELKIGSGPEPYTVVDEAHRIRWESKDCSKSPYDAIFEWATIQESNTMRLP